MALFLYSTVQKIQGTEKLGTLQTLGCAQIIIFLSHRPEKDHIYSQPPGWSLGEGLPQGCPSFPTAPTVHGKSSCWDDTGGLPTATQGQGHQAPDHACLTWGLTLPFSFPALTALSLSLPTTNPHLPTTSQMKTGKTLGPPHKPKESRRAKWHCPFSKTCVLSPWLHLQFIAAWWGGKERRPSNSLWQ